MLRTALIPIVTALAVCLPGAVVLAGYSGPHGGATTVAEVLKDPKDDSVVLLRGTLVRQLTPKKYVFSDGTGEIEVKIKAKKFPAQPVDDKTRLEITGEVEKDFRKGPHIDVDSVKLLEGASN